MTRAEAAEHLSAAVGVAVKAGLGSREIQDAIEFGFHDAGQLGLARDAADGQIGPEVFEPEHDEVYE